jgi:PDF receptor
MKSVSVYMSLRGHHDWHMRRQAMFSGVYGTANNTEAGNELQG